MTDQTRTPAPDAPAPKPPTEPTEPPLESEDEPAVAPVEENQ